MEESVKKITDILSELDKKTQMKTIVECVSKIGTLEWQEAIKELIKKIENL